MNNDNSGGGELGKAGKRRRDEEETATDRLSHLPEPILYHILSFLDTKLAVQTSVLLRYWNRAWKHVPVLNLDKESFLQDSDQFEKFVSNVLSLRYNLNLRKVVYVDDNNNYAGRAYDRKSMDRLLKVINYALSHGVQHLVLRLRATNNPCNFSSIFSEYCDDECYSMSSDRSTAITTRRRRMVI
ncbi:unnamed protein product [Linum tenue]|uniref:F-box domain-containing protein n=1 Tax=Linum tenue TaxID=586396 RepID=A0AAV0JUX2_9ROSI|nr:unnamed protein product [Linum tenue]